MAVDDTRDMSNTVVTCQTMLNSVVADDIQCSDMSDVEKLHGDK